MKREKHEGDPEEHWLVGLKRALVKHGVTADAIASVIKGALTAKRMVAGQDGQAVELGDHHGVQLKAVEIVHEIYAPRRVGQIDGRTMLVVAGDAKVQLMMFGDVVAAASLPEGEGAPSVPVQAPERMSDELKAHLVRVGKVLPSGEIPEAPKATEAKALPEPSPEHERFLRETK